MKDSTWSVAGFVVATIASAVAIYLYLNKDHDIIEDCPTCPVCPELPVCETCPACPVCPELPVCETCPACPVCPVCPEPLPERVFARFDIAYPWGVINPQVDFYDQSEGDIVAWHWDFGDETTSAMKNPPRHLFENWMICYKVTLRVFGASGNSDSYSKYVAGAGQCVPNINYNLYPGINSRV